MMPVIHQIEIALTLFVQQLGNWLIAPMTAFTQLGIEQFYLLTMPALFWCFDAALGIRIGLMLLLSNGFNSFFKTSFHSPRPYWIDERVNVFFQSETSFGLPSGHAQNAASVWGVFAANLKKGWRRYLVIAIIFFIGFSRIYLGVHFTSDVLLGWLVGGLLLLAFLKLEKPVLAWFKQKAAFQQIILAFAISVLIILLVFIPLTFLANWQLPPEWHQVSQITSPGSEVDPLNPEGVLSASGTLFGMIAGLVWLQNAYNGFNPSGTNKQCIIRYLIGVAGILVFWYGLGQIFPRNPGILSYSLRYVRYALIGLWVTAGAPILFFKMKIAQPGWAASEQSIT
ncbi:MAG: phosphatase PAP2 family protein [Anaerolineaceae bacterium]|nr:phosphatase PAP2 family protein [Anaerolineaceae bacterium]